MPPTAPLSDFSTSPRALLDEAAEGVAAGAAPSPTPAAAESVAPSLALGASAYLDGVDGPPAPWELPPREADLFWPVLTPLPAPPARHGRGGNAQPARREAGHSQRPAPFGGPDARDGVLLHQFLQDPALDQRDASEGADASTSVLPPVTLPTWAPSPAADAPFSGADFAGRSDPATVTPAPTWLRWLAAVASPLQEGEGGTTTPRRQGSPTLSTPNDGPMDVHYLGGDRLTTQPLGPQVQRPGEGPWRPHNVWDDSPVPLSFGGPWRGGDRPYVGLGGPLGHLPPRLRTAPPYETLTPTRLTPAQAADAECCLSLEPFAALAQPVAVRAGQAVHLFEYTWLMRHWVRPGQQTNPTNRQPLSTADMLRVLSDGAEPGP